MPRTPLLPRCILVLTIVGLTACSRLPQSSPPATPTIIQPSATATRSPTITPTPTPQVVGGSLSIWHSWSEGERTALAQIMVGFRQLYPNVLLDVQYIPIQEISATYESEVRQGRGPAILLAPAELGPALWSAGLIDDLTAVISTERLASLNRPAVEASQFEDALIGVPYSIQGVVLYRNQDIVTIGPNTFEDLQTLAETTSQGEIIGAFLERSFFYSGGHLIGLGGRLMDEDGRPAFNDSKGQAWIELLQRIGQVGPPNYFSDDDLERFKAGQVGWIIDGTWNMHQLAAAIGADKLAIDPWPTYEDGRLSGFVMSENLYLNPNRSPASHLTVNTFVEYFLSPEAQTLIAEAGRIPATAGIRVGEGAATTLLSQAIAALADGAAYPVQPQMAQINIELDVALRAIFEQNAPAAQALDSAATAVQAALEATQTTATPPP